MDWRGGLFIVLVLAVTAIAWFILRRLLFRSGVPAEQANGSAAVLVSLQAAAAFAGFWIAAFLGNSLFKALRPHLYSETDAAYAFLSAFVVALLLPPAAGMVYLRRKIAGADWLSCFQTSSCLPLMWLTVLLVFLLSFS